MLLLLVLFINSVAGESETAPYKVLKGIFAEFKIKIVVLLLTCKL